MLLSGGTTRASEIYFQTFILLIPLQMIVMASQITSLTVVFSIVYSGANKTSKLRVTGLCEGNSPMTGEFPAQKANNAENVFIWWRHHVLIKIEGVVDLSRVRQ